MSGWMEGTWVEPSSLPTEVARRARVDAGLDAWFGGATGREAATIAGVSRQWLAQLAARADPDGSRTRTRTRLVADARSAARERAELTRRAADPTRTRTCPICGGVAGRRTCGRRECVDAWRVIRRHVDPAAWAAHAGLVARRQGADPATRGLTHRGPQEGSRTRTILTRAFTTLTDWQTGSIIEASDPDPEVGDMRFTADEKEWLEMGLDTLAEANPDDEAMLRDLAARIASSPTQDDPEVQA